MPKLNVFFFLLGSWEVNPDTCINNYVLGAFISPTASLYEMMKIKALTATRTVCENILHWGFTICWTPPLTAPACFSSAIPAFQNAHMQLQNYISLFPVSFLNQYQGQSGSCPFSVAKVPMYCCDMFNSYVLIKSFYYPALYMYSYCHI